MLKFFRGIRRKLLKQGRLGQYLGYAIGEILLVMIGILLALQVNNWNEWRKDRNKEAKLLYDLVENIDFNINALHEILLDFQADDGSSDLIISVIKEKQVYHDSLDYHFARALNAKPLYVFSFVGYESMKNTGFDIIQDDQLKKEIINLFEMTYRIVQLRQDNVPDMWNFISKRFMRHPLDWQYKPLNFDELLEDKEFLSMINGFKGNRRWIGKAYEEALNESQRVLQLIKEELSRRNPEWTVL